MQTYRITTKDDVGGQRTWIVRNPQGLDEARRRATKAAALDHIGSYDDYAGDSAYHNALASAARTVKVLEAAEVPGPCGGRPVSNGVWLRDPAAKAGGVPADPA